MEIKRARLRRDEFRKDPETAFQRFLNELDESAGMTYFFAGSNEYLETLQEHLLAAKSPVSACTSAGEIWEGEYLDESLVGISFSSPGMEAKSFYIDLSCLEENELWSSLKEEIDYFRLERFRRNKASRFLGTMLIDGLSKQEESVADNLHRVLLDIPLLGGSSGMTADAKKSFVWNGKEFVTGLASLSVLSLDTPFKIFQTHNFVPDSFRFVITKSAGRSVYELDGMPAAEAYAKALGIEVKKLSLGDFVDRPLTVNLAKTNYVRSIESFCSETGRIDFFCAIEEGMVVRLGKRQLENKDFIDLSKLEAQAGFEIKGSLFFECFYRRRDFLRMSESERNKILGKMAALKAGGFHTFGEQYGFAHMNQTLIGAVFGE